LGPGARARAGDRADDGGQHLLRAGGLLPVRGALPASEFVLAARRAWHAGRAVGGGGGGAGAAAVHLVAVDARGVRQPPGAAAGGAGSREMAAAAPGRVRRTADRGRIGGDAPGSERMTQADAGTLQDCSLLLATDLSPRCDRATDRAIVLARDARAPVLAMTV